MPSKQVLEKHMNAEMQGEPSDHHHSNEKEPWQPEPEDEEQDAELSEKKARPPRFSALFGVAPPLSARELESCPAIAAKRRSGIWMPTALFVLLIIIVLLESTLLFAYTLIGLYNNLPARLLPVNGAACNYRAEQRPAVNIAPNFILPQAQAAITKTHTVTVTPASLPNDLLLKATSTTGSSSTSSVDPTSQAAGSSSLTLHRAAATSTLLLSEVAPLRSTVNSVTLITVDASGSTIPSRPTVTSTRVVDASEAAAESSSRVAAESSISAAMAGISAALSPKLISSSSTFLTSATPTSTPETTPVPAAEPPSSGSSVASSTTITKSAAGKVCFGGSGAVQLNCI